MLKKSKDNVTELRKLTYLEFHKAKLVITMLYNRKCVLFIYEPYFMSCTIIIDQLGFERGGHLIFEKSPSLSITSHTFEV